jgi:hypothetical protein
MNDEIKKQLDETTISVLKYIKSRADGERTGEALVAQENEIIGALLFFASSIYSEKN